MDQKAGREALIQAAVMVGAVLAVVAAIWSAGFPQPFPVFELLLTVAAAAATREFGIPLPGKGFASFVLGVVAFALLRHGWAWGAVAAAIGMPAGDLIFRRMKLRAALINAGHLTTGTTLVGFIYQRRPGRCGASASAFSSAESRGWRTGSRAPACAPTSSR